MTIKSNSIDFIFYVINQNDTLFLYKYNPLLGYRKYYIVFKEKLYSIYPEYKDLKTNYAGIKNELSGFEEISKEEFIKFLFHI